MVEELCGRFVVRVLAGGGLQCIAVWLMEGDCEVDKGCVIDVMLQHFTKKMNMNEIFRKNNLIKRLRSFSGLLPS